MTEVMKASKVIRERIAEAEDQFDRYHTRDCVVRVDVLRWALELIEAQEKTERVNREWLQQQYTEHVQLITTLGTQLEAAEERIEAQEREQEWLPVANGLPSEPGTYEFLAHELRIHVFVLVGLGECYDGREELKERYSHWRPVTLPVAPRHPDVVEFLDELEAAGGDRG